MTVAGSSVMELHSTSLIDKHGRVYWAHLGGDPFGDTVFLAKQLERMNRLTQVESRGTHVAGNGPPVQK